MLPPLSLLETLDQKESKIDKESLLANAKILEKRLEDFGVNGKVVEVRPGPVITMYEYEPAPGVKINKIVGLSDDLALALRSISVRIVAPIPGKAAVGIEIPNSIREPVYLKDILDREEFSQAESKLTLALGKDIFGSPFVTNLEDAPSLSHRRHRGREERFPELYGLQPSLQGRPGRSEIPDDRPQTPGALGL